MAAAHTLSADVAVAVVLAFMLRPVFIITVAVAMTAAVTAAVTAAMTVAVVIMVLRWTAGAVFCLHYAFRHGLNGPWSTATAAVGSQY